jgi:hypothetical protein
MMSIQAHPFRWNYRHADGAPCGFLGVLCAILYPERKDKQMEYFIVAIGITITFLCFLAIFYKDDFLGDELRGDKDA